MPTLQDVAILAGVSTATVSRTLNKPELVEPVTRTKVAEAIKVSGYTRNEAARSLAMRSSRTIGLLTDNFASSYFAPIMDETVDILREYGYYTIVEATGNVANNIDPGKQRRAWQSLISRQVESIIVLSLLVDDAELENMLREFPNTVLIDRHVHEDSNRCITVDHYVGGQLAAKHLLDNGHRNIAMISGPENKPDANLRGKGFIDELLRQGCPIKENRIFQGNYTITSGTNAMQQILNGKDEVSAVFAQNDDMAAGVVNACYTAGIKVPEQMSVVGFDNSALATAVFPHLTTVSQPLKSMSHSAATLALNLSQRHQREGVLPNPQTHFMPALIERMSVMDIRPKQR